jgi:hypothetical protein
MDFEKKPKLETINKEKVRIKMKTKIIKNKNLAIALMMSSASLCCNNAYASQDANLEHDTGMQNSQTIAVPVRVDIVIPPIEPVIVPLQPNIIVHNPPIHLYPNWQLQIVDGRLVVIPILNDTPQPQNIIGQLAHVHPINDTTQPVPLLTARANIDRSIHNHGGARNDELLRPENIRSLRNVTHLTYENLNNGGGSRLIELINNGAFPELTTLTLHGHLYHTLDNLNLNSVGRLRQLELHGHELSNPRQQELRMRLSGVEIIF